MRGEVEGFLLTADSLPPAIIDEALYQAAMQLYRKTRAAGHWKTIREKHLPLVEGQDEVELGAEVAELVKLERFDAGGAVRVWNLDRRQDELDGQAWDSAPRFVYSPLPNGRIRLREKPSVTLSPGMRAEYRGQPTRLSNRDQEPDFPLAMHEHLIVFAVERLVMKEGVLLSKPAAFEAFRKRMEPDLQSFLVPSFEDSKLEAMDRLGIYTSEEDVW